MAFHDYDFSGKRQRELTRVEEVNCPGYSGTTVVRLGDVAREKAGYDPDYQAEELSPARRNPWLRWTGGALNAASPYLTSSGIIFLGIQNARYNGDSSFGDIVRTVPPDLGTFVSHGLVDATIDGAVALVEEQTLLEIQGTGEAYIENGRDRLHEQVDIQGEIQAAHYEQCIDELFSLYGTSSSDASLSLFIGISLTYAVTKLWNWW